MRKSVWNKDNITLPEFQPLKGDKKTDVLIIGGGLCGILCAYFLKQQGVDYILAEGNKIASGITKNTTAKITSQHGLIYDRLIQRFGTERAKGYLRANQDAVREYERLCKVIGCRFEKRTAYTYSMTDRDRIEKEVYAVNILGVPAEFQTALELPFQTQGAVCFKDQAQFHPLEFIAKIAQNLNIYENTFIRDVTPKVAVCDGGKITFQKMIVCTHFPFINQHGGYFLKLYQHRSYVTAFEHAQDMDGMYVDENLKGLSFRSYQGMLLIGGGSHRTGKRGGGWEEIHAFAKKHYPDAKPIHEWATQDCMSLDAVPYIGQYAKKTPDWYVATGFNKWGMTGSMVAAKILCDKVAGKSHEDAEIFSPQRSILKPQLFVNGIETITNFLTPTTKRCPHLGCALKWNRHEHTWDCPCHGSRFEEDGTLIDNPATEDAKTQK